MSECLPRSDWPDVVMPTVIRNEFYEECRKAIMAEYERDISSEKWGLLAGLQRAFLAVPCTWEGDWERIRKAFLAEAAEND